MSANTESMSIGLETEGGWSEQVNTTKLRWIERHACFGSALDIGAGAGWYARYLAGNGYTVTAIDVNPLFNDPRIKIVRQSLEESLPFADASFDTVMAWDVVEHIEDEAQALDELARVTKPGGRILVSVPHADDSRLASSYLTYCHFKDKTHRREYLPRDLVQRFSRLGFRVREVRLEGGGSYPFAILCFIDNRVARAIVQTAIKVLIKLKIIKLGNCHGDVFGAFEKPATGN